MITVFVPTMLQSLTGGVKQVDVEARNVRQLVDRLDELYPGLKDRLVDEGTPRRAGPLRAVQPGRKREPRRTAGGGLRLGDRALVP